VFSGLWVSFCYKSKANVINNWSLYNGDALCFLEGGDQVWFEVLTAVSTKMTVFWVVAPCSLVEVYQRFRGPRPIPTLFPTGPVKVSALADWFLCLKPIPRAAYSSPWWWRQQGPLKRW
jgi:hypothetical protein